MMMMVIYSIFARIITLHLDDKPGEKIPLHTKTKK